MCHVYQPHSPQETMLKRAADLVEALYGMQRNTPSLPPPRSPASMAAAMSGFNAAYAASAGQQPIELDGSEEGGDEQGERLVDEDILILEHNEAVLIVGEHNNNNQVLCVCSGKDHDGNTVDGYHFGG